MPPKRCKHSKWAKNDQPKRLINAIIFYSTSKTSKTIYYTNTRRNVGAWSIQGPPLWSASP